MSSHVTYRILYLPTALENLRGLTASERARVLDAVDEQLAHQPDLPTRNRKQLRPNPLAPWELRIGDLRVFYDIEEPSAEAGPTQESTVVILAVGVKRGNQVSLGGEEVEL